jgi:invasion protein IalB
VETVKHDNWTVTCQDFAEGRVRRSCAAQLQVVQAGSNQVLFAWTIGQDGEGRLVNVVQTLPGVLIAPGIELKLGKAGSRKLPFVSCEPNRCTATLPADEGFVKDASAAETAEAVVYGTNGRGVQFGIPLKGIDKAFAAARAK